MEGKDLATYFYCVFLNLDIYWITSIILAILKCRVRVRVKTELRQIATDEIQKIAIDKQLCNTEIRT